MRKTDIGHPRLDERAVKSAYKVQAPFYDYSFGVVSGPGRRLAISILNQEQGRVLEIGIGTGLSLPRYKPHLHVTGIDLSSEMLEKAVNRVRDRGLPRKSLALMDAGRLAFEKESFDAVAAMYVMTVVPDPALVMSEIWRVLRPGGHAVVVNHFSRENGIRGAVERGLARFSNRLGWHPVFPIETVTAVPGFRLLESVDLPPLGLFTLLRFQKIGVPD
jgi:phosphatidylethanolamine/phosphatidyl-N-methylethanolamine N-methyltransferase